MNAEEVRQGFQQAAALFQAQQYEQTLQVLDRLDNAAPNNQDIMYFKARVLGVLSRVQESAALCDRLTALGDARGEQLKAALNVTPPGPPPMPPMGTPGSGGPPPIMPDRDAAPAYATPPQFAAANKNKKLMNLAGFGLMGTLLLAAAIVVIVRSGGGDDGGASAPPRPAPPAGHMASAEGGEAPQGDTPAAPAGEVPGAPSASPKPGEPSASEGEAPPQGKTPSVTPEGDSFESTVARISQMDPAEQVKAMAEMDTEQLAELLKRQAETVVNMMEQQGTADEGRQLAAQMRQEFENTDFTELARMTKEMMSQADPNVLAQLGSSPLGGMPALDDSLTDDAATGLDEEDAGGPEKPESADAGQPEEGADTGETTEQPAGTELAADDSAAPEVSVEAADSSEDAAETAPDTAPRQTVEEPVEEKVVKPVFGNELAKVLVFPKDENLGTVYLRRTGAPEREPWERVANAQGKVGIPPNQDVKLQLETYHITPLQELKPDDIQVLSLWSLKAGDKDLEPIKNLKGLKELDIRQTRITAQGWEDLQKALPGCRILY